MVSLGRKAAVNTLKGLSPKLNPLFPVNKGPEEWEANAAPLESWGLGNMKRKKHLFAWYRLLWVGTLETQGQNEGSL